MCSERQAFLCFVGFFDNLTECCNSGISVPTLLCADFFLHARMKTQLRHVAMVERELVDKVKDRTMMLGKRRTREGVSREDQEMFRRLTSRNGLEEQFPKKETRG